MPSRLPATWPWPAHAARRAARLRLLVALAVAVLGVSAPLAVGRDGLHADDFAGDRELPAPSGIGSAPVVTTAVSPLTLSRGPRTAAVIMFNFTGLASTPWTADDARAGVFTGGGSVNAFEQEQSLGAIALAGKVRADGDVFGWYTIAAGTSVCDPDTWMVAANAAASADGVDLAGYQHRIYLFPNVAACGWAGAADMPGSDSFINGTLSVRVIAHELGHNLGAQHASTISCLDGGARVTFSSSCTQSEYGDPFDVMGSALRHSAAFRKAEYGFIPLSGTATVTQSGTFQLASVSVADGGTQSLRVKRGAASDYWYMELRSPSGVFDNFGAADPAVTGVGIRLANDYGIGVRTRLVDTTPATGSYADAPLQAGQTFTDPLSGISIAVDAVVLGAATVRVTLPGSPPPGVPGSPLAAPATGPPAPEPPSSTATVVLRRVAVRRAAVRLGLRAGGASRCAVRLAAGPWSTCRVLAGRIALARNVPLSGRPVPLALRIDDRVVLSVRVRVPRIGRSTRIVAPVRFR